MAGGGFSSEGSISEDRLDEDFLYFLSNATFYLKSLPKAKRDLGEKWLLYFMGRKTESIQEKILRNMHLSDLLGDMSLGDLTGIYAGQVPDRNEPLPPLSAEKSDPTVLTEEAVLESSTPEKSTELDSGISMDTAESHADT